MSQPAVTRATEHDQQVMLEIIEQLDAHASSLESAWSNKRQHERKRVRVRCNVFYVGGVRATLVRIQANLRDISLGGLGFVSSEHLRRKTPLVVALPLSQGKVKHVTGHVAHSRKVREGWFLTGVQFGPVDDERLSVETAEQAAAETQPADAQDDGPQISPRQQALDLLSQAGSGWRMSPEKADKIFALVHSPDHVVRRATIPVLVHMQRGRAIPSLLTLLCDSNTDIQAEAAEALGAMQAREAVEELAELLQSRNEVVVLNAAQALGRVGDKRGLRVVADIVNSESANNRRAARALGIIVGQEFRPNSEGVAAARRYVKQNGVG